MADLVLLASVLEYNECEMLSESSLDLDSKLQGLRVLLNDQVFLIANRMPTAIPKEYEQKKVTLRDRVFAKVCKHGPSFNSL